MITSRDNATLKLVRKLAQKKHRLETGLFAAEGEDLVEAARAAGIEPVELLVAGETVEPELLAGVSTLPHPARAIGVYRTDDLPRGTRPVVLGLWRLADPGNVGALLRSADAFGAAVSLSDGCADPLAQKALRASAGAIFRVPLVAWGELPANRIALVSHGGEATLAAVPLEPPLALLLGSERDGLPEELATDCCKVTIASPGRGRVAQRRRRRRDRALRARAPPA